MVVVNFLTSRAINFIALISGNSMYCKQTMDQYDVIKAIGEGAFGKAYLAKRKLDSEHCVIKEINFEKVKLRSYNSCSFSVL